METKFNFYKKTKFLLIMMIMLLSMPSTNSQVTIFPDSWPTFDAAFTTQIANNLIYESAYFTNSATTLYLNKQGITLKPLATGTYVNKNNINLF